ncbi:MAG TPA: hypothetical protein VKK79_11490 [Candidatus Lokiarchaeia archaeon]|nr:hypothetical protein [Candidatus Lokiarchaeia archaeon]
MIQTAIEAYQNGESAENAADLAHVDLWTFLEALRARNILHHQSEESIYREFLIKHQISPE